MSGEKPENDEAPGRLRVVFMGTGDIALPSLEALTELPTVDLIAVVTGEDKPVGRRQTLTPPRIRTHAAELGVPLVLQPARLRDARERLVALAPDLMVVMAYGHLLPGWALELPRLACINLHASLLPRHRGASPIQAAVREGDRESGITVMHVAPELDAGDIILSQSIPLAPDETGGSLHDRLAELAPDALREAIQALRSGTAQRRPQDSDAATYARKLTREDGEIDWSLPAGALERRIRAFDPWPGSHSFLHPRADANEPPLRIKIFPPVVVRPDERSDGADGAPGPGMIVSATGEGITVATGSGTLTLSQLQPDGKRRMSAAQFLAGHALCPDRSRFGPP